MTREILIKIITINIIFKNMMLLLYHYDNILLKYSICIYNISYYKNVLHH